MSQTAEHKNLQWFGFLTALVFLALLVLMGFAMFSTQDSSYINRGSSDYYGPAGQFRQFQENAGKALDRAFGEVL